MSLEDRISKIQQKLMEHEKRISELEEALRTKPKITKKSSIREFILSKSPKSEMEKVLTVAYYLQTFESLASFNVKDLEKGFRRAKEKIPTNLNYEVIRNIRRGYMMEAEEKKDKRMAWGVTNSGEKQVDSGFEQ